MRNRILVGGLVALLVSPAGAARAIPDDAIVADIAVRPDGTTIYLFNLSVEGTHRIGYSTRSDPADPATESPVLLVPRRPDTTAAAEEGAVRLSRDGRFIIGNVLQTSASPNGELARGLLFDTRFPATPPAVLSPRQVPLFPEEVPDSGFPTAAQLSDVSNAGVAVGFSGIVIPAGVVGRGIRATPDGAAQPLEPFPVLTPEGDLRVLRSIRPTRIADSGAVVGALAGPLGFMSEPVFLDPRGPVPLSRPRTGISDSVIPEVLESTATRELGRIVANAFFETRGGAILVYEGALSTPSVYRLTVPTVLSLTDAALDASSFIAHFTGGSDPGGVALLRVASSGAQEACDAGVDAGTFRGRSLRRVDGASVFASGTVGFRFCIPGDREGEALIGHDLLRELAAIEGSGFDETSGLGCFIGDNGAQASILCDGLDASFTRSFRFSDRARLVRNVGQTPFSLPACGSGGMQAAFVIPLLAILGRRGRSRRELTRNQTD